MSQLHTLTRGEPKLIELVFALIKTDSSATLDMVIDHLRKVPSDQVGASLMSSLLDHIDEQDLRILQALEALGVPAPASAVNTVLDWPNSVQVRGRLDSLAQRYIVKYVPNDCFLSQRPPGSSLWESPRILGFALARLPAAEARALLLKAAHYHDSQSPTSVQGLPDLGSRFNQLGCLPQRARRERLLSSCRRWTRSSKGGGRGAP